MTHISVMKAHDTFSDLIDRVALLKERVTISRQGKPIAVLVPLEDLKLIEELEDKMDIRDAREALKEPGGITLEELEKNLGF
jgi:prevent-host-death family protein